MKDEEYYREMLHQLLKLVYRAHPMVINNLPYSMQDEWKSLREKENG